jgi:hypothetical protein
MSTFKVGDTTDGPRKQLLDRDGNPADLTNNLQVVMQVVGRDVSFPVTVEDAEQGIVVTPRGDLDVPTNRTQQRYRVEFEVTYADGTIQTFPEEGTDVVTVFAQADDR